MTARWPLAGHYPSRQVSIGLEAVLGAPSTRVRLDRLPLPRGVAWVDLDHNVVCVVTDDHRDCHPDE